MARTPVDLAREWIACAEEADASGMAELLSDEARFYADQIRGQRFKGRREIEAFLASSGFEATGYSYTPVDDCAVVTMSLRRHIEGGGLADSTIAMVFRTDGDEIVCMDAFPTAEAAFASLSRN
jgi:hypothetical protein